MFYLQISVGHVEAGLRTYNIFSPYPEEFNRQAVGIISKYNLHRLNWQKNTYWMKVKMQNLFM